MLYNVGMELKQREVVLINIVEEGKAVFKKLAQKLAQDREKQYSIVTNPLDFEDRKRLFLNKMTHAALDLYGRKCDVNNFSKLVLSDPENESHNILVDDLFASGVKDPFMYNKLMQLSDNKRFLRDLGLE